MKRTIALGMSVALAMGGVATPAIAFAQTDNPTAQQQGEQEKYEHIVVNKNTDESQRKAAIEKLAKALKLEYKGVDLLKNDGYVELPVKKQGGGFVYDGHDINMPRFVLSGLKPNTKVHINFGFAHSDAISFEPNKENLPQCTADYIAPSVTIGEFKVPEPYVNVQDGKIYYSNLYFNTNFNGNTHVNDKATKFTIKEKWVIESADVWVKTSSTEHSIDTYIGKGVGKEGVSRTQLFHFLNGTEYDTNNTIRVDPSKRGNTELVYINWSGLKPNSSLNFTINTHHLPTRHKKFEAPRSLEEKPYIFTNEKVSEDGTYKKVFEIERYGNGQNISLKDIACDLSDETITLLKGKSNKEEPTKEYEKVSFHSETDNENSEMAKLFASYRAKIGMEFDANSGLGTGDPFLFNLHVAGLKPDSTANISVEVNGKLLNLVLKADENGKAKSAFTLKEYDHDSIRYDIKSFEGSFLKEKDTKATDNSIIQFKDQALKKRILSEMKEQKLISQDTQDITEEDALKVKKLNLTGGPSITPIQLLNGLEKFKNITYLSLYANRISDITPLKGLINLTYLSLSGKISNLTPLTGMTKLEALDLDDNQISDITPLTGLTNLTWLKLNGNQISDAAPIKNLINLRNLELDYNRISDITSLRGLTELRSLSLSGNKISDITPLRGLTELDHLSLNYNKITDATPLARIMANFYELSVKNQSITLQPTTTKIDLAKEIKGFGNIAFNSDENIADGVLTYKEGMKNPYQVRVSEKNENHEYSVAINVDFSKVMSPAVQFKDPVLKEHILSEMKKQKLIDQSAQEITEKDALKATNLSIATNSSVISSLDGIEKFKNLTTLNLSLNYLSDITPLKNLTNLTNLDLDNNQISDIAPLKDLTNLTSLSLDFNSELSDIAPLKNLTNLTYLGIGENKISDVSSLKNLDKLTEIHLNGNQISDVAPLKDLTNLKNLWLTNNQIRDLECLNNLKSEIDATDQNIIIYPTTTTVDLKKEIKGFGNVTFNSDVNTSNGVLTYKIGMENPYAVDAFGTDGNHKYKITVRVDFSKAKLNSETQAEDTSEELQKLLDGDNTVKATDNYKNADDNLKQAYDKAITDGKAVYDKLSSTPEQVKQAAEQIKTTLEALNGDKKAQIIKEQLSTATQKIASLQGDLEKAKQQNTTDKSKIDELTGKISTLNGQLEQLKQDNTKSVEEKQKEITKLNSQIEDLNKQVAQLTKDKDSLQQQLNKATENLSNVTTQLEQAKKDKQKADEANQQAIAALNGQITQLNKDKQDLQGQIDNKTQQISTLNKQIEQVKQDKTKGEQEKQKEIDRLNGQIAQLNKDKQELQGKLDTATGNVQKLTSELEKAKQQGTADASTIANLNKQVSELQSKLEKLKSDKTLSDEQKQAEIDKLNGQIEELNKQIKDPSTRTRPENGSIILPNGNVINPDGTVVLLDGNKIKPDGTIVDSQDKPVDTTHATVDKDGNKVLPNGIKIKPNGDKELPDGVIVKNNGNVILPDGKVVYFAGGAIVAPLINDKPEFDLEKYKKEHPEEFNNSTPDNNSSNGGSSTGGGLSVTVINGDSGSGSTNTTDKKETPKEDTGKEKKEPVKQSPAVNTGAKATISFVTKAKDLITTIEKEVDEKLDKKDVSAVKATAIKTKLAELKQRLSSSTEDEAKPLVDELKQIKADLDKQRDSQKIEKTNNLHDKRVLDKDKQGEGKFPKTSDNAPIGTVGVMVGMLGILFGSKYKKAKHAKK